MVKYRMEIIIELLSSCKKEEDMAIKDLFEKDIERDINGVVQVETSEEEIVAQELDEYVVTRELNKHFSEFFTNYAGALDVPTQNVGVWISGYFGSGKSHFLKMLSYILENDEVKGRHSVDYFKDKINDPMLYADMMRSASDVKTESILFNIDNIASHWKGKGDTNQTALLRAFQRAFYEHLGFYAEDLRLAKLEKTIDEEGKTQEFRDTFEDYNGKSWVERRREYDFWEDDITDALVDVMGWSEEHCHNWFNSKTTDIISPDAFVDDVKRYVDKKIEEYGNFRLLFMVDEIGQFIGTDVSMMLNLQTLVENFGSRCKGAVWIMVTSQEALDEFMPEINTDFSKILGRFHLRLSLSSSSVDEVIKKRILTKKASAVTMLKGVYDDKRASLKNLYTFEDSVSDLVGYNDESEFVASYPFVDYQFKLMPRILHEIRLHGLAAKHTSTGERSMLAGFQEALKNIKDEGSYAIVPFWRFYDALSSDFEHNISQVVNRAQNAANMGQGLEDYDVKVLKLLYLILYINDVKSTVNNIATMMVEHIDADRLEEKKAVGASLARLVRENYIVRNGDEYKFMTDEEQDIEREIKNTVIDPSMVTSQIIKIINGIIDSKKYRYNSNDYDFCVYVDNQANQANRTAPLNIHFITPAGEKLSEQELVGLSADKSAYVVLDSQENYYETLSYAAKIDAYVNKINVNQLSETKRAIIQQKQKAKNRNNAEASRQIEAAINVSDCYVNGHLFKPEGTKTKDKLSSVLRRVAECVFSKAYLIETSHSKSDVANILKSTATEGMFGSDIQAPNEKALREILEYLNRQKFGHVNYTIQTLQDKFTDKPYGWTSDDISACLAYLLINHKVMLKYQGLAVGAQDRAALTHLTNKQNWSQVIVEERKATEQRLLNQARNLGADISGRALPSMEDSLVEEIIGILEEEKTTADGWLNKQYAEQHSYPGREIVEAGREVLVEILQFKNDNQALLSTFVESKDAVMDYVEYKQDKLDSFFQNQYQWFDRGLELQHNLKEERNYLAIEASEALELLNEVGSILSKGDPFNDLQKLPGYINTIKNAHQECVVKHRNEALLKLADVKEEISNFAGDYIVHPETEYIKDMGSLFDSLGVRFQGMESSISNASDISTINAKLYELDGVKDLYLGKIAEIMTGPKIEASPDSNPPVGPEGDEPVKAEPTSKTLSRSDVFKTKILSSEEEVDVYLKDAKQRLMSEISQVDSVIIR